MTLARWIGTSMIAISTLAPHLANAWGDMGHKAVAEIAARNLSPKGLMMVREILGDIQLVPASTFPDFARSYTEWSEFAAYHFIDVDPRWGSYENIPTERRQEKDANAMIEGVPHKMFSKVMLVFPKYNRTQKANMLRYLVHIVGDVHQPLHVGNSYDKGGNLCYLYVADSQKSAEKLISSKDGAKPAVLHAFWDGPIVDRLFYKLKGMNGIGPTNPWDFYELVSLLEKDPEIKKILDQHKALTEKNSGATSSEKDEYNFIAEASANDWYRESVSLYPQVYPDKGVIYAHPEQRPYCKHYVKDAFGDNLKDAAGKDLVEPADIKPADVPVLAIDEIDVMTNVAKMQIFKAGIRLAKVINDMAEGHFESLDPEKVKKDLEKIKLKNEKKALKPSQPTSSLLDTNNPTCEVAPPAFNE